MSISTKKQFLMTRYGYSDADIIEYAQDHGNSVQVAVLRLFEHHITLSNRNGTLFEQSEIDIDTQTSQEIDGRLF